MLAKNLTFLAHADAAGIVLGARVPIVLTSRADSVRTRLASCAVAALYADARRRTAAGARGLTHGRDPRRQRRLLEPEVPDLRHQRRRASSAGCAARSTASACGRACAPRADGSGASWSTARYEPAEASPTCRPRSPRPATGCAPSTGFELRAIGHRVVHGGPDYARPVLIDAARARPARPLPGRWRRCTSRTISRRSASRWRSTRPCRRSPASTPPSTAAMPRTPTATPCRARFYDEGVRRYGFHGLSYEYVAERLREVAPEIAGGRVIVAHLGSGASMCALLGGRSIESTMGFTALDGLPMGTRPGQLDPGVVLYLIEQKGHDRAARSPTSSTTAVRPQGPLRHLERHARPARERRPRAPPSPSTTSSTAARCTPACSPPPSAASTPSSSPPASARTRPRSAPASPSGSPGSAPSSTRPPTMPARPASPRPPAASPSSSSRPTRS